MPLPAKELTKLNAREARSTVGVIEGWEACKVDCFTSTIPADSLDLDLDPSLDFDYVLSRHREPFPDVVVLPEETAVAALLSNFVEPKGGIQSGNKTAGGEELLMSPAGALFDVQSNLLVWNTADWRTRGPVAENHIRRIFCTLVHGKIMVREHRREFAAAKVLRREKSHIVSTDFVPNKAGRWCRLPNTVAACCSFIFTFFAIILSVSYFFEPSILTGEGTGSNRVFLAAPSEGLKSGIVSYIDREPLQITVASGNEIETQPDSELEILQNRRILTRNQSASSSISHDETPRIETSGSWPTPVTSIQRVNLSGLGPLTSGNPLGLAHDIKIYVYELPSIFNSDWLADSRCSSHLFAAEVVLHRVLLESPIRTINPDEADFFFVPIYVSCNFSPKNGFPSLAHAPAMIKDAVELISREAVYWNRSRGRDHIFVAAHDYGACFHSVEKVAVAAGIPEVLQNSILLQTFESVSGHRCQEVEHIQIPPYVDPEVVRRYTASKQLEKRKRSILAYFRGKLELHPKNVSGQLYSRGIRTRLWKKYKRDKQFLVRRKRVDGYQAEMLKSVFCLAPLGWAPWSPRIVEAVMYGCVPVIIADKIALPYSNVIDWPSISLTVGERDVDNLRRILLRVVASNLTTIQQNLWQEKNRRALMFSQPLFYGDASWQILDLLSQKKFERTFKQMDGGGTEST
ncbi:hypothetical protein R1flu_007053 [Riccia fluitans]|uniref:Exostosin GT47 domain-containing protein n=1 Tax=Riccia fluitans TaxID=41844 RepID=A0ABD1Z0G1_9MARC